MSRESKLLKHEVEKDRDFVFCIDVILGHLGVYTDVVTRRLGDNCRIMAFIVGWDTKNNLGVLFLDTQNVRVPLRSPIDTVINAHHIRIPLIVTIINVIHMRVGLIMLSSLNSLHPNWRTRGFGG